MSGPGHDGDDEGDPETEEVQDARNWQLQRLAADDHPVIVRQIGLVSPPQRQEPSVQKKKCDSKKCRKDCPLKGECLPEHVPVTERPEPEGVNVIR